MSNIKVRFENTGIEMRRVIEYQEKVENVSCIKYLWFI